MSTYLAGKTKINKLKEKHMERSEQLVNRQSSHQFLHQFRIWGFWEKYPRQLLRSIRMYKSKVNYFFKILSYTFYQQNDILSKEKQNGMGHCWKWPAMEINNPLM